MIINALNGLVYGSLLFVLASGLVLVYGLRQVVNFAHGALFMLGAFVAVSFNEFLGLEKITLDPEKLTAWGTPLEIRTPYIESWLGDFGALLIDYSIPVSILIAIPIMLVIGLAMERGLIRYFYNRPHADQILVWFLCV